MKKTSAIFLIILFLGSFAEAYSVIPRPADIRKREGSITVGTTYISAKPELSAEAAYLTGKLLSAGYAVSENRSGASTVINLFLEPEDNAYEFYVLDINSQKIVITGNDPAGVFYGIITLLQIIEKEGPTLGLVTVYDSPRYHWRGFMLDEARHFFGMDKVKQILDLMAYFKLNKFHWHLSDSEGWRVEIKNYPRLASIGGQGCWSDPGSTEAQFYTQDQIREIIEYAAVRHIEVIPEIDMPGHANASNKAYPEYSGGNTEAHGEFTFNPGKEETYAYLTNVLGEVMELFPTEYMHIGGDEVSYGIESWNTDPHAQALMRREGFETLRQAEKYFIDRMSDTVRRHGKKLIGWEELVELDTDKGTTILWWRQNKPEVLTRALAEGYNVVLCPRLPQYFDFIQDPGHKWGRVWVKEFNRLENVYAFPDSMFDKAGLPEEQLPQIIGMQANLWTERVPYPQRLDYMIWPRLCASAESAWTAAGDKDFEDFEARLIDAYRYLDKVGVYYYDHRDPGRHPEVPGLEKGEAAREKPMDFID